MKRFLLLLVGALIFSVSLSRAQPPIPTDSLQLWLKADAGVTLNGSTVSSWIDQSGNGNNALQSTTNRQPLLVNNALNDKPVLHFDGINDRLALTGSTTMSQVSLFLVFKIDSGLVGNVGTDPLPYYPIVLGNPNLIDGAYGLSMRNFFSSNSPNIIDPWLSEESWVHAEAPNIAAFNQWKVLNVVTNQTMWNTTVRSNGVNAVITPQGSSNLPLSVPLGTPDGISGIGGADNVPAGHLIFKGDIAEVIVYNTVLSDSERLAVENYLTDKYNISNTSIPAAGLQLWLKADEGVTLNGSTVSNWIDQSGNGNNALQSTTNRQPLLVNNALNDKPVLHFDGIDDRLALTGSTTMSQISLFLVFKIDSGLVGNEGTNPLPYFPIALGNPNLSGRAYGLSMRNFFSSNSPNIIDPWVASDSWVHAQAPNIAAFNQWKVLNVVTNQTMWNTTVRSNGVDAVITPQGTFNASLSVSLGTPDGISGIGGADNVPAGHLIFKGDIAEVVVYDTVLSESDRLAVENYLADKYNITIVTGIEDPKAEIIPEQFTLSQNYPNPFNPTTIINFQLPIDNWVTLKVYDVLGREVRTLVNEFRHAGSYEATFDASGLSSGVYLYRLQAGRFIQTKKLMLLR